MTGVMADGSAGLPRHSAFERINVLLTLPVPWRLKL